jgi:hypothetical protein
MSISDVLRAIILCECCGFARCICGDCHNELCDEYIESFSDCIAHEEDHDEFGEEV